MRFFSKTTIAKVWLIRIVFIIVFRVVSFFKSQEEKSRWPEAIIVKYIDPGVKGCKALHETIGEVRVKDDLIGDQ